MATPKLDSVWIVDSYYAGGSSLRPKSHIYITNLGTKYFVGNPWADEDLSVADIKGRKLKVTQERTGESKLYVEFEWVNQFDTGTTVTTLTIGSMKPIINLHGAALKLDNVYQIQKFYDRIGGNDTMSLTDGHYVENPWSTREEAIGKHFRVVAQGDGYNIPYGSAMIAEEFVRDASFGTPTTSDVAPTAPRSTHMNGAVYSGVVVRTRTVAAGVGIATGVQISEVAFDYKERFIAQTDEQAKAVILTTASIALKDGLNINDPAAPVEVRLQKF